MNRFAIKILKNKEHISSLIEATNLFEKLDGNYNNNLIYLFKDLDRFIKIDKIIGNDLIGKKVRNLLKLIDDDVQILEHVK